MSLWLAISLVLILAISVSAATNAVIRWRRGERMWYRYALVAGVGLFGFAIFFINGIAGRLG